MDNLNNIPSTGNWGDASARLNDNFSKVQQAVTTVENAQTNNKGYFSSMDVLNTAFPYPKVGQVAYVADLLSSTGYYICNVSNGAWVKSSVEAPPIEVNIDQKADHGYVTYGEAKTLKEVEDRFGKLSINFKYTYWPPTSSPTLIVNDNDYFIKYQYLTIVDVLSPIIYQASPSEINVPKTGIILIYAELNEAAKTVSLWYDYIGGTHGADTSRYKPIADNVNVLPILMVDQGVITDILRTSSIYFTGYYDSSVEGLVRRLYPENTSDPFLFIKIKSNLHGTKNGIEKDIRVVNLVQQHDKFKTIYLRGSVSVLGLDPDVLAPYPKFYISDIGYLVNKFEISLSIDANGLFETLISIPESVFDTIDLNEGYNIYVFIHNFNSYNVTLNVEESYFLEYPGEDNKNTLLSEYYSNHLIQQSKQFDELFSINFDENNYGNFRTESLSNYFPRAPHVNFSATTTNSESPSDGYLTEISARVENGGVFVFKVGLLDQYPRFIVSRSFNLTLSNGLNIIDVSHLNIPISRGEQIAISCTDIAVNGTGSISYQQNSAPINHELFFGENNGIWHKLETTYGGEIILSYKIRQVDSIFAKKTDVSDVNTRIDIQNTELNKLRYIYDESGTPYKLSIYNGQILIKSVQYANVLALGNSLTSHPYLPSIGYYGDDSWAMASTNKVTTTWTNHLQTILRQKQSGAIVTPFNIFDWETNYMNVDLDALFSSHIGVNYDLIIFRAGENGTAGDDYTQGVDRLITYLRAKFPQADIILTDMFWHNDYKESCFKAIADKYNYPYCSFGNIADHCLLGQMTMGVDDVLHPVIHNGVAGHCTDVCFFDFANILANLLQYAEITGRHSVVFAPTSTNYSINNITQIKDGYVSILTYGINAPSITVTGVTSSNQIAVTHHDIRSTIWINTPNPIPTFVTTFKMPDEGVNIAIL